MAEPKVNPAGAAFLSAARESFTAKLRQDLKSIEVPELGEGLRVYWKPETAAQRDRYFHLLAERRFEGYVQLVHARACGEDGKRLFREIDLDALRKEIDPKIIQRIATAIMIDGEVDVDEAGKS